MQTHWAGHTSAEGWPGAERNQELHLWPAGLLKAGMGGSARLRARPGLGAKAQKECDVLQVGKAGGPACGMPGRLCQ